MAVRRTCCPRIIPAWAGNAQDRVNGPGRNPDHPRVGGERGYLPIGVGVAYGSSPRGRGTLRAATDFAGLGRIIPAWAGNAVDGGETHVLSTDHPRVGGERARSRQWTWTQSGSSPRGRGTRVLAHRRGRRVRIIPAWAGNASLAAGRLSGPPDHPRVGGERTVRGVSWTVPPGSSPRGRGTLFTGTRHYPTRRIIPAWAGNARSRCGGIRRQPDHPRVGGERLNGQTIRARIDGSSPRGRGTLRPHAGDAADNGIIPAWAGNAASPRIMRAHRPDHPRVGGERAVPFARHSRVSGSSPRGRGTRVPGHAALCQVRIIPAWAGNANGEDGIHPVDEDHPRVGGERPFELNSACQSAGSSPRGRGTRERSSGPASG